MQKYTQPDLIKELQRDLSLKYALHGARLEQLWRSWGPVKREQTVRAGARNGEVLRTPTDKSMGRVYLLIPEWNIQDLAGPDPELLLQQLHHRATTSVFEQYTCGPNRTPGDYEVIIRSMRLGLRHTQRYPNEFTQFLGEDDYGMSYTAKDAAHYQQIMGTLAKGGGANYVVPRSTGELVLQRQLYMLQSLNILVEDILEVGSTSRDKTAPKKKPRKAAEEVPSADPADSKPQKLPLPDLLSEAQEQKSAAEDYLALCRTEPSFLAPIVNMWFMTRPELLPDERGQRLPLFTDKYKTIAFFEVLHAAIGTAAVWEYVCRLLQSLVDIPKDQKYRTILLQELSNVCHFEYSRVQNLFKRYVQTCSGSKYFRRASDGRNNGTTRVVMKVKPESLAQEDPQLHYVLSLCETKTDAVKAMAWIRKLDELHRAQPRKLEELMESESEAFGDLSVTAAFIQTLAVSLRLPPPNRTKGQVYISKLNALASGLDSLKDDLDLSEFVVPIDNLLEHGVARRALVALDNFIIEKAGAEIGQLYESLAEEGMTAIQNQWTDDERLEKELEARLTISEAPSPAVIVDQRREKAKTRPAHSSVYSIVPKDEAPTEAEGAETPVYKVKPATFEVFSSLFSKTESQGSISWAAFRGAMADLNFSVVPRFGSVFTFLPPKDFLPAQSFNIHRPHQSRIEGHVLIYFAKRLKRVYGWGESSFEIA